MIVWVVLLRNGAAGAVELSFLERNMTHVNAASLLLHGISLLQIDKTVCVMVVKNLLTQNCHFDMCHSMSSVQILDSVLYRT